ncbi:MAG: hypothetical protein DLM50_02845 [Candidatus Meridianibacter frigidus]|nr:MAG: hypothetical protein DLM50_02845 [Candidatus Eremiobacteraeota bacterium]
MVPFIVLLSALGLIGAWLIFAKSEGQRYRETVRVAALKSDTRMRMTIMYNVGRVSSEEYRMEDNNGRSISSYRIAGSNGKVYTVQSPPAATHTVPFFFEKLVQDGIWKVTNRPPLGDGGKRYTLEVDQTVQGEHGSRTVTFTDPHYLATTAGRQFQIHLDRNKPTPDLLKMSSSALADKRYLMLVEDFRHFGTPAFLAKVAEVQAKTRAGQ